ncbi:alpha/beta fold hydrolase [Micropruina sonneratiae]|uniref:alpha/beta fold hydrolase n=1 Tax=Micropruina sonneratiae TaxID=2986940 RepID=UPI0039B6F687
MLLLHGSGSTTALSWTLELRLLSEQYRLHAIDLVGEPGRSAPARPALTSPLYSAWLTELANVLDARPAVVIGLSLGGWLAVLTTDVRYGVPAGR